MSPTFLFASEPWLWVVPGLIVFGAILWFISRWVAKRRLARFMFSAPSALSSLSRRLVRFCLAMSVLILLALALARPLSGPKPGTVDRSGVNVAIVLDVSKSMLVEDVAPSRLGAIKNDLRDWLKNSAQDRISLVPFAGHAFVMSPLTFDYEALDFVLQEAGPRSISMGGTNVPEAIETAAELLEKDKDNARVIVLISDGENLEGDAIEAARKAHTDDNITIITVGVGTVQGGVVPADDYAKLPPEKRLVKRYAKDEYGVEVRSRADGRTLREIAEATGGRYYAFTPGADTFRTLQQRSLAPLARKSRVQHLNVSDYVEWFQIPLGCAILFMFAGPALALIRKRTVMTDIGVPVIQPENYSSSFLLELEVKR